METFEKERAIGDKKSSLRVQSRQLDYAVQITEELSFRAKVFLKEQKESPLSKQEASAALLTRLSKLAETAAKLSTDCDAISRLKLKEADSITLANFKE